MRNIAVVTGTRAEYGLLKNILKEIQCSNKLNLQLIVTGIHLSYEFGMSVNEIIEDGFRIDDKITILMDSEYSGRMSKEMGLLMLQLSQSFERLKPDILLILGDRYEIFAAASTAMTMNIPIAHISGGEITEGAIDEQIRHAITKMSHIHFPGCKQYYENIKNMGEEDFRIFNVGDPGVENIKLMKLLEKKELKKEFGFDIDKETLLVTYHPVTLELNEVSKQIKNLINALNKVNKNIIITYPNCDRGSDCIIKEIKNFESNNKKVHLFKNLGILKYLSIMKYCGAVVGNSSSSLVEAPCLKVPVVNIGNRQKGRLMASNIICCSNDSEDIEKAVNFALSNEFNKIVKKTISLYGYGNTSKEIVNILETIDLNSNILKKKLLWS